MPTRNRKVKTRRVKASALIPHPLNWRTHPDPQRNALSEVLNDIGDVDYLKVVETNEGLMLLDGHLRADIRGDETVDVVVLDLDEDEQRLVLATFDGSGMLAGINPDPMRALLEQLSVDDDSALRAILDRLEEDITPWEADPDALAAIGSENVPLVSVLKIECPIDYVEVLKEAIAVMLQDHPQAKIA